MGIAPMGLDLQFGWRRRLPMMLQTGGSESELVCLAMIARFYGHEVDLPSLRRQFSTSLNGGDQARMMEISSALNLRTRALRVKFNELPKLKTPCILRWGLEGFVVLKAVKRRHIVLHDPARGVCTLVNSEALKCFAGIALEVEPGPNFKPAKKVAQTISLRRLTGSVRGLSGALVLIFLLALALEVFALVSPLYMQWVLDQVLVSADKDLLTLLGIAFVLATIFQAAVSAARAWTVTWLSARLSVQWIGNLFAHLLHLPLSWFEKRHIGDVVSRFSSIDAIQKTLTTSFVSAILDGVMAVFTIVILCLYSMKLSLLVLAAFALYAILRWIAFKTLRRAQENQIVYASRQQSELLEAIRGAQTLKLHNQQTLRSTLYTNAVVETTNRSIAMQRLNISFNAGSTLIFGLERVILIWLAAHMVLDGMFTVGMLVAFTAYAEQFTSRAGNLINTGIEFWMLGLHAERVADIALASPESHLKSGYVGPLDDASIELRNVYFRYSESTPWILKGCSLRISAGESVVIAGPSGSGKTTLMKVLLGLFEPEQGEVLFGGIDIRTIGLARYRALIGTVMQEDQLFAGSIADNIAFFDPNATLLSIEKAARSAAIHESIVAMPMGYQTLVGDMGSNLSGGQKQRVILARALYRQPKLLMLDEATSHLDINLERQISAVVYRLSITRIIIAHSPLTISNAQRVLEMIDGTLQAVPSRRCTAGHIEAIDSSTGS